MSRTPLPLRFRITLWVVGIYTVVQVTLSLLIVLYHRESVQNRNERRLVAAVNAVAEEADANPDRSTIDIALENRHLRWFDRAAAIDTNDKGMINIMGPFDQGAFDHLRSAVLDGDFGRAGEPSSGRRGGFYFAAQPHREGGRFILAVPTNEANAPLRTITHALVLLLPAGMAAAGVSAWYVAGVAVRPLRQVQHFAEELSAENVGDELELDLDDSAPEFDALREELGHAMRRLSAGYEAQARFLANVSHEIKTPISVVRTEGEVVLAGKPGIEDLREFARSTVEEMDRLGRMVESFLLLTRIRQGKGSVQSHRHSANEILMDSVGYCNAMARQYSVRLEPKLYEGDDDPEVMGSADLLSTALGNLIRNAIRFSPRDRAVRISCDASRTRIVYRVRDFGPGVPAEVLDHLFEPFTQSVDEMRRGRGTGLGLQIAHGIAELHDGEVRVRNLPQGCEFSLRLRLVRNNTDQTPQNETTFM